MRKTRRLLLLALVLSAVAVGLVYRDQLARQAKSAPAKPKPLAQDLQSASKDWVYYKGDGDRPVIEVRAREMEQVSGDGGLVRLKGVDLRLYSKDGKTYDHVESAAAEFDQKAASLYAGGEVNITLRVPEQEDPAVQREHLLKIVTSGVHFASGTGKAETDQPARFEFDLGSGEAVGATYDPQARDLHLHKDVKLDWRGRDTTRPPMHVEAAGLIYREAESKVHLLERSRFERKTLKMDGGDAVITLDKGVIRNVEAQHATGVDEQPRRKLNFAAAVLKMDLDEHAEIQKVLGETDSKVDVQTPTGNTSLTSERVFLQFTPFNGDSVLQDALAQGRGEMHSRPSSAMGTERIVHSEAIYAKMRPGGEDLELAETRAPGTLDLVPLTAGQPKRRLEATRMWIDYAPGNVMERFRATETRTRTDRPPEAGKPAPIPAITSSKDLVARFDPKSGAMTAMEQTTDFRYDEGPQHATATKATLDQITKKIVLIENARSWDASGQVTAKTITLDQAAGTTIAEGDVVSTREPERAANVDAKKNGSAPAEATGDSLLSDDQPMHGKAARMTMSEKNTVIVHEGGAQGKAIVWQGANRIEGKKVTINRALKTLAADGDVTSLLVDKSDDKDKPQFTTVKASALEYAEASHLAHYTGGVRMMRPGLDVRSAEMRAWLPEQGGGLDHLFADGGVNISQTLPGRWRKGQSDHAEYYTEGGKVILTGNDATMTDSVKGATRGKKLTYTSADDSLLVEGAPEKPANSRIRRK